MAFKLAIIGLGKIAQDQHLPVVAKNKDFELAAVVSSRGGHGDVPAFRTPAELFSSGLKLRTAGCTQTADALFLAFSPQQPGGAKLAQLLDEGMQRMRKSGELARILQRYGVQDWVSGAKEVK